VRVTAGTVAAPTARSSTSMVSSPLYVAFTQQLRTDTLVPRDREPCLVDDVVGQGLAPGYYPGRLSGSYTGLPVYEVVLANVFDAPVVFNNETIFNKTTIFNGPTYVNNTFIFGPKIQFIYQGPLDCIVIPTKVCLPGGKVQVEQLQVCLPAGFILRGQKQCVFPGDNDCCAGYSSCTGSSCSFGIDGRTNCVLVPCFGGELSQSMTIADSVSGNTGALAFVANVQGYAAPGAWTGTLSLPGCATITATVFCGAGGTWGLALSQGSGPPVILGPTSVSATATTLTLTFALPAGIGGQPGECSHCNGGNAPASFSVPVGVSGGGATDCFAGLNRTWNLTPVGGVPCQWQETLADGTSLTLSVPIAGHDAILEYISGDGFAVATWSFAFGQGASGITGDCCSPMLFANQSYKCTNGGVGGGTVPFNLTATPACGSGGNPCLTNRTFTVTGTVCSGSSMPGPGGIQTSCCTPPIPTTLTATFTNVSGCSTFSTPLTLTYDPSYVWV
jgi:hypothetical protein